MALVWRLTTVIHAILCSRDILYTLRAQDALRRFHHYGLNNIYGIRTLNRRSVAPFPVIHTLDTLDENGTLVGEDTVSTVYTVDPDVPEGILEPLPNTSTHLGSVKIPEKSVPSMSMLSMRNHISNGDRFTSVGELNGVSIQLIEIRKIKRVGGGYPYGPKNFTIAEFIPPLRVEKPLFGAEQIVFKTHNYSRRNESTTSDPEDFWAVQRFDPPSALCNVSLSCRYCLTYWKIQKKFKPFNVYIFCCR
ncbi:hypothetical protein Y032_0200g1687 [Ancylostoma ceylanicum]|uniref:Uncharacterized protein n=1 Tax=Ancylostoma ceylanicum TaxID=53326 RepID=A0A016SNJ4_9BILA|nr:hypothetical protein Y032_0200g1687 [Ancylostoma ceylanicum]